MVPKLLGHLQYVALIPLMLVVVFLEKRYRLFSKFFAEQRTALDLAVLRISVLTVYLITALFDSSRNIIAAAAIDKLLVVPPAGWGAIIHLVPRDHSIVMAGFALLAASGILAIIGLWTRLTLPIAVVSYFYLFTILESIGKIDHMYHMPVLIGILLCFSPCADALSVDAWLKRRRDAGIPQFSRSSAYAAPLNMSMLIMGLAYLFPGLWKLILSGAHWFSSDNMALLMHNKLIEYGANGINPIQTWFLNHTLVLTSGAIVAIVLEFGWILLILSPKTRPAAFVIGLAFHNLNGLMLHLSFWTFQFCYAALVDWEKLSNYIRGKRIPDTVSQGARVPFINSATIVGWCIFGAMFVTGVRGITDGWPAACFPIFTTSDILHITRMNATTKDGRTVDEFLSVDPVLQREFDRNMWRQVVDKTVCVTGEPSKEKAAAVMALWQKLHPGMELRSTKLSCEIYKGSFEPKNMVQTRGEVALQY